MLDRLLSVLGLVRRSRCDYTHDRDMKYIRERDAEVERLCEENEALRSLDTYGGLLSLASDLQRLANYAALLRDHQEPGHSRLRDARRAGV